MGKQNGRPLARRHGNLTPPAVCRSLLIACDAWPPETAARSDYDDKGVPLCSLRVVASKLPCLLDGGYVGRSRFPVFPISGKGKKVMAHTPSGSAQRGCIRMPYTAPELSAGLSLSRCRLQNGKGKHLEPLLS